MCVVPAPFQQYTIALFFEWQHLFVFKLALKEELIQKTTRLDTRLWLYKYFQIILALLTKAAVTYNDKNLWKDMKVLEQSHSISQPINLQFELYLDESLLCIIWACLQQTQLVANTNFHVRKQRYTNCSQFRILRHSAEDVV
jgi:hypothetical protein